MLAAFAGVSVGEELDAKTLEALEGYQLLWTDVNGWIEAGPDGEQLWVDVERASRK